LPIALSTTTRDRHRTHAGLLKANLDKTRLKTRKDRIRSITAGDAIGTATKQAIEAVQAPVLVAVIMPGIIASSH
jgi:Golgi phosphoprotein 3